MMTPEMPTLRARAANSLAGNSARTSPFAGLMDRIGIGLYSEASLPSAEASTRVPDAMSAMGHEERFSA